MNRTLIFLWALLTPGLVMATDAADNHQFLRQQLQLDRERFQHSGTPDFLKQASPPSLQDQAFADSLAQQRQASASARQPADAATVFVSFSMPEDELRTRLNDAADLGVAVTLRGMVNGDMRETGTRVANLVKDTNKGGIQIDPVSFRRHGVTSVPTVVVTCGAKSDRVLGDITLREALRKVAEEGDCASFAGDLLDKAVSHD